MAGVIKRQRIRIRCLCGIGVLFRCHREGVVAEVFHDFGVVRIGREDLVAFPAAQGDRANVKQASSLRLEDLKLEPTPAQVTSDCGRLFWNWYSTIVSW